MRAARFPCTSTGRGGVGDARVAQPAADSSDSGNLARIEPIRQSVQEVAHVADPVAQQCGRGHHRIGAGKQEFDHLVGSLDATRRR